MSHEQFTRGDLAFNRGVTLFCRRDMSSQFKLIWIQGTCRGDKISSPQQDFSWKSSVHTMGFVAGTKSPRHVPATCPLVWADLKGAVTRWKSFVKLARGNMAMWLHRVTWQLKHFSPLRETLSAVARVGCCSTFREIVSGNFLKEVSENRPCYRGNFRRNLYRVAVSRRKASPCYVFLKSQFLNVDQTTHF